MSWHDWTRRTWLGAASGVTGLHSISDMALAARPDAHGAKRSGSPKAIPPRSRMKISSFRVTLVASPDRGLLNSWDVHPTHFQRSILELETADGFTGIAEVKGETFEPLRAAQKLVLGRDPFELEYFRKNLGNLSVMSAVEVACLDIIGKRISRRVCDLIGGAYRESAAYSAYLFFVLPDQNDAGCVSPEGIVQQYADYRRRYGFRAVKFKGGVLSPDRELETLQLIHSKFPDAPLRIDPNAAWSVETSLRLGKPLRKLEIEYYEDPTPGFEEMAAVRHQTGLKLATNMIVTRPEHVAPAFRHGSIDILLLDHHYMGGLQNCRYLAATCETLGWGCSGHSSNHLGISMAAMTHMNCSIAHATYAADTHYPWTSEDVIQGGKLPIVDGQVALPDAPGLGVSLDSAKLAALADNVHRIRSRHDALKKWNPQHPTGAMGVRW